MQRLRQRHGRRRIEHAFRQWLEEFVSGLLRHLVIRLTPLSVQCQNFQGGTESIEQNGKEEQRATRVETRSILQGR